MLKGGGGWRQTVAKKADRWGGKQMQLNKHGGEDETNKTKFKAYQSL